MLQLLAVTCYLPNASFVYNPITNRGQLRATYIPQDDTNAYQICSKLDSRLARASIELANEEEAFSSNFDFRHGDNIDITIDFTTEEQQASGLLTAQSNFKVSMLDMDAEVKQTLAFFSVQSYNADDCLINVETYIVENRIIVRADQAGCNYGITKFGKKVAGLTQQELNQTVIATISCFEMSVSIPVGINFSTLSPSDSLQVRFDCDAQENSAECLRIIQNFTFEPMTNSYFELKFQLIKPETDYFSIQSQFDSIVDPQFTDCYTDVQYQTNGELVIFYFTPSGTCEFNTLQNELIIAISDSQDLSIAKSWLFLKNNMTFDSTTTKLSLECKALDYPDCSSLLTYLGEQEILFVTLRFILYREGIQHFVVTAPTRYQECFQLVELTVSYENGASTGSIDINNIVLGLPACILSNPNRIMIQLQCFMKTVADGFNTDIEKEPFLTLNNREIFSTQNQTVLFERIADIELLTKMSRAIIGKLIYCTMQYDDIIIPVIKYTDETSIYDNTSVVLISILGGIFCVLIYGGIEVCVALKCNYYKGQQKVSYRQMLQE